jgi:hypothetical protein
MPFDVRLRAERGLIDPGLPRAVALLGPPGGETVPLLIDDGVRAFRAEVRVTAPKAVGIEETWYPYAAGAFGAEIMV